MVNAFMEEGAFQEGYYYRNKRGKRDFMVFDNEIELGFEFGDGSGCRVQNQTIQEGYTCVQALVDNLSLAKPGVLKFSKTYERIVIKAFDAAEKCQATGIDRQVQIVIPDEEIARHQSTPFPKVALFP